MESDVPPPLPPFPPQLKAWKRKSVQLAQEAELKKSANSRLDPRKNFRRKLSTTSSVYFEVGSLSDISKACEDESNAENVGAEANSDGEVSPMRGRKFSNVYLDIDAIAALRSESGCRSPDLTPPEPPPRHPSLRPAGTARRPQSQGEAHSRETNFVSYIENLSVLDDIPPKLPARPNPGRLKKSSESSSTIFFSSFFGSLTRKKKKLNSQASLSPTSPRPLGAIHSVADWPLPAKEGTVAENDIYNPPSDEELETIDSSSENLTSGSELVLPPFPELLGPINKSWYPRKSETTETALGSQESAAEVDGSASEDDIYMSMSGVREAMASPTVQDISIDCNKLDTNYDTSTDSYCQSRYSDLLTSTETKKEMKTQTMIDSENPYLLMGGTETNTVEYDLYMNVGQFSSSSEV